MKFLRPIYAFSLLCFFVFNVQSCTDEPVEIVAIVDTDNDGIEESVDNCPLVANPNQEDDDNDGIGNTCDDDDGDGILNADDNCPSIANPNQEDTDNNGIGDTCDDDDYDDDGILNANDNCSLVANPNQEDDDNDGIGNLCDEDYVDPNAPLALCENGLAGIYPCNDYDLMANIPLATFFSSAGNDCWGWTDTTTGKEYALMATNNKTAFIDITTPYNPIYLGNLPTATVSSSWRDVKV
ncbi:choice-of-anchor B family protein, partial [uncultured Algibacter sp.]|uniref:choice-of-anchor B family protein n=1 Tax=uncultured Algibacter sp. TaxID=298659 RepID=UPI0025D96449